MSISSLSGAQNVAHARPSRQPPSFEQLDTNADSVLTLDELKTQAPGGAKGAKVASRAEALFKAMDQDGDGSVTSTEKDSFDTQMAAQRQQMQFMTQLLAGGQQPTDNATVFSQTDTDGDGSVSLAELGNDAGADSIGTDGLQKLFNLIDADGDGAITETESSSFLDAVKSAVTDAMGPPPPTDGPPGGAPPPDGMSLAQALSGDDEDDDEDKPFDLLSLAQSAYSASSKQSNILDQLQAIFDGAA
jgi:Ca2+-binding EF-hand superfamily protein